MRPRDLPITDRPKETAVERRWMRRRLFTAGRALKTSAELDALLDKDPNLDGQPQLRAEVRRRIQDVCAWLRDN